MSARRTPRTASKGMAIALAKARDGRGQHQRWLDLTEVSGPFLTMPVLLEAWPQLDPLEKEERPKLRARHADWQDDTTADRDEWVGYVLRSLLEWGDALTLRRGNDSADDLVLDSLTLPVPEHDTAVRPDFALAKPGAPLSGELDADSAAKRVCLLGLVLPTGTAPNARVTHDDWAATPADRLARLCRHHDVPLGLATDGRWWCLVWAPIGGVTTTAVFDAISWGEAAERDVVRAFRSLLSRRRFFSFDEPETLVGLLKKSLAAGDDVTDALGVQVRQAVELLVDAIGRADARAMEKGTPGLRAEGVAARDVYRGAVAVMMRIVFLFYAEERGLLPSDNPVYAQSYSARFLRDELKQRADADGEDSLEHTTSAWHRLIALFHAVHGGVDHPQLRLPAYDGSIFDPRTYPWLESRSPLLPIDDRTVLHMLQSVQEVHVGSGKDREVRTLSFRALDVEQIGYVYEGLLSYGGERAVEPMVGLIGPAGSEHEVPLRELEALAAQAREPKALAKKIREQWKEPKQPASESALAKALGPFKDAEEQAEARRLLQAVTRDAALTERLMPFFRIIRRDLRELPVVIHSGALFVTESALRKNTGTHYTPRFLAEDVVRHALEPLVYEVGPLQTADESKWVPKSAAQILELKVADIAMGSAAFLVAACRYLGDRLLEAWAREGHERAVAFRDGRAVEAVTAVDAESDPVVTEARREIIEHCLYGADINPMAVEMAKLSLWLVSMDPERPFTFLDDRLVAGDSLLGISSMEQIAGLHLKPTRQDDVWAADARARVDSLTRERLAITAIKGVDLEALRRKRERLAEVNEHAERLRLVGDLLVGAGLGTCASGRVPWYERDAGEDAERLRDLFPYAAQLAAEVVADGVADDAETVQVARKTAREWLAAELPDDGLERTPLHWPLVFPEVFTERGGFDAIVGNPPFMWGRGISGAFGESYREYLVDHVANEVRGAADFVTYFLLRIHSLLSPSGQSGIVATGGLGQGENRKVGLDQIARTGVEIRRSIPSALWPTGSASVKYCAVWTSCSELLSDAPRMVGAIPTKNGVATTLTPESRQSSWTEALVANTDKSFQGMVILGDGFLTTEEESISWISADPRNKTVLLPYINGSDINSHPDHRSERWVIDFAEMTEKEASSYELPFTHALTHVHPERMQKDGEKYPRMVYEWWKFWNSRPALREALARSEQCITLARSSDLLMPALVPSSQIFSEKVVVFPGKNFELLSLLSSSLHYWWSINLGLTRSKVPNYSNTGMFESLPPAPFSDRLMKLGIELHEVRSEILARRNLGFKKIYAQVNEENHQDADLWSLRRLHKQIDEAAIAAYGWLDLLDESGATEPTDPTHIRVPLDHGFHDTDQGPRYTIGPVARTEIIDRLRQLNHQAYADEVYLGLHKKPKSHPDMPSPSQEAVRKKAEGRNRSTEPFNFEDGSIERSDGMIF
ncbi:Eco57I restriction-modification methylase domain-containing protein [Streptomyces hydrogenans]|uniref:Eco57I restriction-modification methylase domain-containing protein n=1 Tax=Streptomyces hydrogenans TaxID=1873719 RepID=UPI00331CDA7C